MDFWNKPLAELSDEEWEALCDGCGLCCLHKFEDEDTGELLYTDVACGLLDIEHGRCSDYANRTSRVPECLAIREFAEAQYAWLPTTCAYRLRHAGQALPDWHPLISGDPDSVVRAGISVCGRCVTESEVAPEDWVDHVIDPL